DAGDGGIEADLIERHHDVGGDQRNRVVAGDAAAEPGPEAEDDKGWDHGPDGHERAVILRAGMDLDAISSDEAPATGPAGLVGYAQQDQPQAGNDQGIHGTGSPDGMKRAAPWWRGPGSIY